MNTVNVQDVFGRMIEISSERWQHVCKQHPELLDLQDEVKGTLVSPDLIKMSLTDKSVRLYYRFYPTILGGKYILVVVKTNKRNFIVTAYVTDYIKAGDELWKRRS
ncbi:MAG: hypothetical protein QME52_12800 [Bacteroidota bacterium]|nr:hypothetical protein [Bacteroidota bacterium]